MAKHKHGGVILYLLIAGFLYLTQWDPVLEPLRWIMAIVAVVVLIVELWGRVRSAIRL